MSLQVLPCLDSPQMASSRQRDLDAPRDRARALGASAVHAIEQGGYTAPSGAFVDWSEAVRVAVAAKVSILPDAPLPEPTGVQNASTRVQVTNDTTLRVAKRLTETETETGADAKVLALNFANGIQPGGGFLNGARAQEEGLCRSSALYATLEGDAMYEHHRARTRPDSTDWSILSPDVPVFRGDAGVELEEPWLLSFLTCAAPVAHRVGQPESGDLLEARINRVLSIAHAYGYEVLVLGAWGCGAFGNDPERTARDFRRALEGPFDGAFREVVFAITDWSHSRKFLGPFCRTFGGPSEA